MDELTENMEELKELLKTRQYTRLRQSLAEVNDADIAAFIESLDEAELLKVFRILPKSSAADVFSYLEVENQQFIITALSDKEAAGIIDNLMADDATDLLEEMPANIVKKLLANASPETRRDINHLLRYVMSPALLRLSAMYWTKSGLWWGRWRCGIFCSASPMR